MQPTQLNTPPTTPERVELKAEPTEPERVHKSSPSDVARAQLSPALRRMVEEIEASIERCPRSRALERTVSLARMRNMSHASAGEFDALRSRLAALLTAAASTRGSELRFVTGETEPAAFDVLGAAYLVTLEGFDSWELFLGVSRRESAHDLWRSEGPVRVLRFEQPMSAQVFYSGAARR
jgi:hypothetical protein